MDIYSTPSSKILESACNLSNGETFFVHIGGDDYYEFKNDNGKIAIYDPDQALVFPMTNDSSVLLEAILLLKTFT